MKRATVYRPNYDGTNGGISATENTIWILGEKEPMPPECERTERIKPILFREQYKNCGYYAAVPVVSPPDKVGPMHGGNIALTDWDGIETRLYRIHDRYETPEQHKH